MLNIAFEIKAEARDQLISDLRINALWEETLGVYFNLDCNPIVKSLFVLKVKTNQTFIHWI